MTDQDDKLAAQLREFLSSKATPPAGIEVRAVNRLVQFRFRRRLVVRFLSGLSIAAAVGAAAVALALTHQRAAAGPGPGAGSSPAATQRPIPSPSASSTPLAVGAPTNPAPAASVCQANPDPATPAQVVVSQPAAYARVTSPLTVSGTINAFEATFRIAIKSASGRDLGAQAGHSQQGQTMSPFTERVPFTVNAQTPACLWVFQLSAKDGSPSMIQQVPISLMP